MNIERFDDKSGGQTQKYRTEDLSKGKINSLLTELLKKEEEIELYKNRLKELETAFYYNLELISERDSELTILEKQLDCENGKLQALITERNELENLVKRVRDKYKKKIKQFQTEISLKEEEMRNLQRESADKVNSLNKLVDEIQLREEKKIYKMNTKFQIERREILKNHQKELEEKENYYLFEIDNLATKLTEISLEKEELIKSEEENRHRLENLKKVLREKQNQYAEEIRKRNSSVRKLNKEVQCNLRPEVLEKQIQTQPELTTISTQTVSDSAGDYQERINFLQEQNEVLKYIVKDLKRNRAGSGDPIQPPGCECLQLRTQIQQINKKFESDINNLKETLDRRTEEDVAIQNLETTVTSLKNRLLSGLRTKLEGEDDREVQNDIQIILLEEKLSKKIHTVMSSTETETKKLYKKLEQLEKEWEEKMEKYLKPRQEWGSENLLENIRKEIQKLEWKIESDMRNLLRNNCEFKKCVKNFRKKVECGEAERAAASSATCNVFR